MNSRATMRTMCAPAHLRHTLLSTQFLASSKLLPIVTTKTTPKPSSLSPNHTLRQLRSYSSPPNSNSDSSANTNTHVYNPSLNPPSSTRPPPLVLPARDPQSSTISHYLSIGKAYLQFYKSGVKAVFSNRRILRETLSSRLPESGGRPPSPIFEPARVPDSFTRADWVLLWRVRHDLFRIPLFGLVLLVCGEFTPLVVIVIDGVVPYTCRLPRQIAASMAKAEARRRESFAVLKGRYPAMGGGVALPASARGDATSHVLRSLHLISTAWDRVGFVPPGLWQVKGRLRMAFLEGDDRLLMQDGGLSGLEPEEVRIACAERGIDVLGKGDGELRGLLGDWLRLTADKGVVERRKRMTVLLTTRMENWPLTRDFELPDWHL